MSQLLAGGLPYITFVMEREGCSFQEACERLSRKGWPPTFDPAPRAAARSTGRRWERLEASSPEANVLEMVVHFYEEQLWRNERALAYLHTRAVPVEIARAQRLGYADGRSLLQHLRQVASGDAARSSLAVAVDLGLVVERPAAERDQPVYREFFFDRLIVPELRSGRPIWCIGRALEDPPSTNSPVSNASTASTASATAAHRPRPKYLSLPGEKPVLGLDRVLRQGSVYLVEGPLDWLAAVSWDLPAFAICGTHFPSDRLPAIAESLAVYGVFDPDRAGRSAAERFAPLFGSRWRPIVLPNGLDLAELAAHGEHGRENFRALVGRARAAAWQDQRV
jgi:DNA primase